MSGFSATSTSSVQNARKELTSFIKTLETVPNQVLSEEASLIYADAIAEVPYKTGKLERAIYVRVSRDKRRPGIMAGASAKSRGYDYAGIQHENESFKHPIKGKAHFISEPFEKSLKRIEAKLNAKIRIGR
jgi:hypothetical protein